MCEGKRRGLEKKDRLRWGRRLGKGQSYRGEVTTVECRLAGERAPASGNGVVGWQESDLRALERHSLHLWERHG